MKHKKFLIAAIVALAIISQPPFAQKKSQGIPAGGHAILVVEKAGAKPVTYNFPNALPGRYNCIVHNSSSIALRYTDIGFAYTFENGGKQTDVAVDLRIEPNGVGTFKLPTNGDQKTEGHISVRIDKGYPATHLMDDSPEKGTGGFITIDNFPTAVGGNITGTFKATLIDVKGALYNISGQFNVQNVQRQQ